MNLGLFITVFVDAVLSLAALLCAGMLRFRWSGMGDSWLTDLSLKSTAIFVGILIFSSYLMDIYALDRRTRKSEILTCCLQGGAAAFFFLSVVYYVHPTVMLGRGVFFLALGFFLVFQFCWHALAGNGGPAAPFSRRVLIMGTGPLAQQLGSLISGPDGIFTLAGYLDCEGSDAVLPAELLVPREPDLLATARKVRAGVLVPALAERRGVLPLQEMMRCKLNGIEVIDAPTFYEMVQGKLLLEEMTPSWIIFSAGFRRNALIDIYKRSVDIVLSLVGLLLSLPIFPVVALAIKLESPGPVFFRQVRVGSGERPFMLFKFRSMRNDAEKNGAVWAVKNDARVTRVGRILRNSRIDEIPQLFNVLRGDMSFIGPRPERPEFVESLKKDIYYYSKRHTIKPGLTGWAQVRYPYGATVEDAIEKLRYDLYYIKNLSFFLDTQIIFETVKVVLFGRGGR